MLMVNATLTASIRPQAPPTILELAVVPVRSVPTRASPRIWGTARPFHLRISRQPVLDGCTPKVAPAIREGGDSRGLPLPGAGGQNPATECASYRPRNRCAIDWTRCCHRHRTICRCLRSSGPGPSEPAETRRRAVLSCTCVGPLCRLGRLACQRAGLETDL